MSSAPFLKAFHNDISHISKFYGFLSAYRSKVGCCVTNEYESKLWKILNILVVLFGEKRT